jgi:hypothetical protein
MKVHLNLIIGFIICFNAIQAQDLEKYSQISLEAEEHIIQFLVDQGFDLDHPEFNKGYLRLLVDERELNLLESKGLSFNVLIEDYAANYLKLQNEMKQEGINTSKGTFTASNFGFGSMGGFYTLSEVVSKLDSMHILFPSLASQKFSIGQSIEGRDIWGIKISDNPTQDENEAAVYYDALHHCREPLSMAVTINYMFWLLENYNTDPRVKYIIDNRELYFVPVVNPDGYVYNEQTNPNGGGLWRKNRRNNGSGCYGVDLNRNYSFEFGHNNSCASSDPCSNTYKGPNAFSEPEVQATRDFIDSIQPSVAFSTHSTAGKYLMPYGFSTSPPQFDLYSEWSSDFLADNDYIYGVTFEMLGYTSCGTTRDYLHSQGIYGWTPEIDGSGFWPAQNTIFSLVDENVFPLFYQAWIAGGYADFQSHAVAGDLIPSGVLQIQVEVKNKGVGDSTYNTAIEIIPSDTNVNVLNNNQNMGSLAARSKLSTTFNLAVGPQFSADSCQFEIRVYQDGVQSVSETFSVLSGQKTVLFSDDAENGLSNWTAAGNGKSWGINGDDSYGGAFSFGDSDNGNTANGTQNYLTLQNQIIPNGGNNLWLTFAAKWSIEAGYDYARLKISTDGGLSWLNLKNYTASSDWNIQNIDLSNYSVAQSILLRFEMDTDGGEIGDGFYFDDIELSSYLPVSVSAESKTLDQFLIYPNPTEGSLNFENVNGPYKIHITNALGEVVFNGRVARGNSRLDVSHLDAGLYQLEMYGKLMSFIKL